MKINLITKLETANTLIIPFVKGENFTEQLLVKSKIIGYSLEELERSFKGDKKEILIVATPRKKFEKVVFIGLGEKPNSADVITAFRSFFKNNKKKLSGEIVIDVKGMSTYSEYFANGISLATYEIGALKTEKKDEKDLYTDGSQTSFWITANQENKVASAVEKGLNIADSQKNILKLVDAPANYKTPQNIADYLVKSGKENGFTVEVFDEKECEKIGLHALLAVGKGSVESPARFVIMEYMPKNYEGELKTVGLIGKGVTFDTGGISLKPGDGMEYMKSDMGGAAAVIGTMEVAAKQQLPVHIIGITPLTENCIDSLAVKPGDVIQSYAGKTIEVINTDAEGRLILADALAYMVKNYKAETIIDLATLTGSCIRTLGYVAAGLMTNNDKLSADLEKAGQATGEKLWRLPLWDDYKSEIDSDIADIKNLSIKPLAGATTAGKFLEFFTEKHPKWAHLDIAGTAFGNSEFSKGMSATAYGVRLLVEYLESSIK